MKNQLKIAIFSGAIPSSTFIEAVIQGIAQRHHVLLFGVVEKDTRYEQNNIHVFATPRSHWQNLWVTLKRLLPLVFKSPRDLCTLIKEVGRFKKPYDQWIWFTKFLPIILHKPDIFHIQWARDLEFYMFLKTKFSIPVVVSLRGAHINYTPVVEPYIADIYRLCFLHITAFHAVSEAIASEAERYNAPKPYIRVIYSPVSDVVFERFREPLHVKTKKDTFNLISVGRFHWIKGYTYALEAVKLLRDKGYSINYTIVSTNEVPESLLFQIHQDNLFDYVTIVKGMPQKQLLGFVQTFDMMLLSSLEEGIANVVLEAMALGLPVISTNCGGMAEVVKQNETGWLVPVRNAEAISEAVIDVVDTPEAELQQITKQAHELVKAEFNYTNSIQRFLKLYEEVAIKH